MPTSPRVLVFDREPDTEAVLKAVLEPRGTRVDRSRQPGTHARSVEGQPEVVVIDLDNQPRLSAFGAATASGGRILIGSTRVAAKHSGDLFLEKPFQFPELINAIEGLLSAANRPA